MLTEMVKEPGTVYPNFPFIYKETVVCRCVGPPWNLDTATFCSYLVAVFIIVHICKGTNLNSQVPHWE
jgi:hypothetical protein